VTSLSSIRKTVQLFSAGLIVVFAAACSSSSNSSDTTEPNSPTTIAPKVTGEPVTDFNAIFEARGAVDHSYLSVDKDGIYGVMVGKDFDFMQYMSTGWISITSTVQGIVSDAKGQSIDGVPVEKAMTVTTRDYTGDRESDFLIRFGSGFSKYGALANSRNGVIELKPFCLTNPSKDRPGEIRVFVVENLEFNDQYKILEGTDYGTSGSSLREYWRWSRKNGCFKITASMR
jgi:hypothetical protein